MPNTNSICGDFVEATRPDYGRCNPRRVKRDCRNHVPVVPGWPRPDGTDEPPIEGCEDENAVAIFDPEESPPNRTIVSIFDENCEAILDENDEPILGAIT